MSKRTEVAVARAGALDRAESLLREATEALGKARVELDAVIKTGGASACNAYNCTAGALSDAQTALEDVLHL